MVRNIPLDLNKIRNLIADIRSSIDQLSIFTKMDFKEFKKELLTIANTYQAPKNYSRLNFISSFLTFLSLTEKPGKNSTSSP